MFSVLSSNLARDPDSIGYTGLRQYGGQIREEWLSQLTGTRGMRVFRQMRDNDSGISTVFYIMGEIIKGTDFFVKPAESDNEKEAQKWANNVEENMHDMSSSWNTIIDEWMTSGTFGWVLHEILWKERNGKGGKHPSKYDDGLIGWRDFSMRAQETRERWGFDEAGAVDGMKQTGAGFIPLEKAIHIALMVTKGNPEGKSLMRGSYKSWYYMSNYQELEGIYFERGPGLPVVYLPPEYLSENATDEQKALVAEYQELAVRIRVGDRIGITFPGEVLQNGEKSGFELKFLNNEWSAVDLRAAILDYRKEVFTALLAAFLLLGQNEHGSYALANSQTSIFGLAINSLIKTFLNAVNKTAVAKLMEYNGVPQEYWPEITHGKVQHHDLAVLTQFLTPLVDAGILTPDADLEEWVRDEGGLPPRAEDAPLADHEMAEGAES